MNSPSPLTFVEELYLLGIDDATGALRQIPGPAFGYALAGALLGELALRRRIDTDPARLFVIDPAPLGDPLLDETLARIVADATPRSVGYWLGTLALNQARLESVALSRLVARQILRVETKKILWVLAVRRYPLLDDREVTEVKTRLAALILGDDLPDARDAVLISLLHATNLLWHIFPEPLYAAREERVAGLARLEQIGREVGTGIDELTRALTAIHPIRV